LGAEASAGGSPPAGAPAGSGGGATGSGIKDLPGGEPGDVPQIRTIEDLDAAMDNLSRLLDEEGMPDRLLEEAGTNREKLRALIESYRKRREAMEQSVDEGRRLPLTAEPGRVLEGEGPAAEDIAVEDARPEDVERDPLSARFDDVAEVAPHYRDLVNEYYRALSENQ
jgi:hypothetical protein